MGARQPIVVTGPSCSWPQHVVQVTQVKAMNAASHTYASPLGKSKSTWHKEWPFLTMTGM